MEGQGTRRGGARGGPGLEGGARGLRAGGPARCAFGRWPAPPRPRPAPANAAFRERACPQVACPNKCPNKCTAKCRPSCATLPLRAQAPPPAASATLLLPRSPRRITLHHPPAACTALPRRRAGGGHDLLLGPGGVIELCHPLDRRKRVGRLQKETGSVGGWVAVIERG